MNAIDILRMYVQYIYAVHTHTHIYMDIGSHSKDQM